MIKIYSPEMISTIENMENYGGSFVKSLAECFRKADPVNKKKLYKTFQKYFSQYENMKKI